MTGCDSDTSPGRQRGLSDVSDSLCRRLARNWIRSHCTSAGNRRRSSYLMSGAVGQGFFSNGSVWRKAGTRNDCLYPQCPPPSLQPPSGFECMLSGNARHQRTCRQMSDRRQPPAVSSRVGFCHFSRATERQIGDNTGKFILDIYNKISCLLKSK
jgi:hypothetical protein